MYATHRTTVIHSRAKQSMTMSQDKKTEALTHSHVIDFEVKGERRIRIMNVLDTFSHGDRPMCQKWYDNVKANRSYRSDMETRQNPINLT